MRLKLRSKHRPTRKKFDPRPYQWTMIKHMLRNPRSNVWATMGSGKTGSALYVVNHLFKTGELVDGEDRVLVLAPLRVASKTWPDESNKWKFPCLRVADGTGSVAHRLATLEEDFNVICLNYECIEWLIGLYGSDLDEWPFTMVIADESTKLKSYRTKQGSKRARALARVAHLKQVSRWVNLTGTPSPNGLKDLWGQNWFIDGGKRLGLSFQAFSDRWLISVQEGDHKAAKSYKPRPGADSEIHAALADVSITVDAAEYFGCEEPVVVPVLVDLPKKARKVYQEMEEKLFCELEEGEVEAVNAAARTQKCLQIASGAVYTTDDDGDRSQDWEKVHDAKLDALDSIYEELAGAPLLVAYQYKHDLARIKKRFPFAQELKKGQAGNKQITQWNKGRVPMLLVHPASAGHGLNLQDGGHHLAIFSDTWNYEHYAQVVERIGPVRQFQAGHPRPVFIYLIQARDTLDELVVKRRSGKHEVQSLLMDYMKRKRRDRD